MDRSRVHILSTCQGFSKGARNRSRHSQNCAPPECSGSRGKGWKVLSGARGISIWKRSIRHSPKNLLHSVNAVVDDPERTGLFSRTKSLRKEPFPQSRSDDLPAFDGCSSGGAIFGFWFRHVFNQWSKKCQVWKGLKGYLVSYGCAQ